uniref:Exodeoxyribonuclease 7 large subunit n=1 Tax=Candidatus Kentrum eta TaxID=2126337 RepID=A0A450V812_9GAMM|nr:MAG: Exodeoxyribonuclease VII large subunit [Candidatus Kentron sp. H]VFK00955.1 MAG: Exodeoxyribonuclease VII large subunit [Candidatus Kentron sp. H]VFK04799.1 MAG: Exodeoxyribonuclease VII large subunit [Candidatus Kentron sp. H]
MENRFPIRDVYTVSHLNQEIRSLVEANFPMIWVEGEISNLTRPRSGHVYFSLRDKSCQVRCVMFRMQNQHVDFTLEDGTEVLAKARASLYPQRGDFQLVVEYLEKAGEGALRQAFEILKRQLAIQGLFASSGKKSLPVIPKQIGIITSPSGAAIRDILAVLKQRFPSVPVLLYPVSVQGQQAIPDIARMLDLASQRSECDVLILTRGGGSLEDLWAFNEETVALAIYRCKIPVVSAVGHEIDFTIADLVADQRAPTPSAAPELVVPNQQEWQRKIAISTHRILSLTRRRLAERRQEIFWLEKRFVYPRRQLSDSMQRVDDLVHHLIQYMRSSSSLRMKRLIELVARLYRYEPSTKIQAHALSRRQLVQRLFFSVKQNFDAHAAHVAALERTINAMKPQRTLERGYAIVTKFPGNEIVCDVQSITEGDRVHAELAKGTLLCTVLQVEGNHPPSGSRLSNNRKGKHLT